MIAQHLAASAPERVASLTLMMTSSGARSLPKPSWAVQRKLLSRPQGPGRDAAVDWIVHVLRTIGSPGYPADPTALRALALESVQRAWHPAGSARQLLAIVADGDRTPLLRRISAPTLIVHGADDPSAAPGLRPPTGAVHRWRANRLHSRHGPRSAGRTAGALGRRYCAHRRARRRRRLN